MGLYDRSYFQDEPERGADSLFSGKSMVTILIVINVAVFFLNAFFGGKENTITNLLQATPQTITQPWMYWKLLTYGFAHSPIGINHLLFNMIGLFVFGRAVESRLGRNEFLRFYLISIVLGGVFWCIRHSAMDSGVSGLVGASGGVVALTMLFVFWYPNSELLLFFFLPVKAWVIGVLMVVGNLFGFGPENSAYDVHLVGIAFATAYFYFKWNLSFLALGALRFPKRGPRLKVHNPDQKSRSELRDEAEADRILQKIHEQGEDSLTRSERKTLERHSRRLRQRE